MRSRGRAGPQVGAKGIDGVGRFILGTGEVGKVLVSAKGTGSLMAISLILKEAPSKYARSFIYTEQDGGDLAYFLIYHLEVIRRALITLDAYLHKKTLELQRARALLVGGPGGFNHRQIALLQSATRNPSNYYTAESHMNYHGVSKQTARNDLYDLEKRGLLKRTKIHRQFAWIPKGDLLKTTEAVNE
jgi:Fic family protein